MTDFWLSRVFFQALNIPKLVFRWGSAPDPGGEFTTLLQTSTPPSRLGRGCPHTLPSSTPSASRSRRLGRFACQVPNTNSWLRSWPSGGSYRHHTSSYL